MVHFKCTCGNALFFENTGCLQCGSAVGYDAAANAMRPIEGTNVRCRNGTEFGVCNWLLPAGGPEYCAACRLNQTVPDLKIPGNLEAWRKMETAKRRTLHTLIQLGIEPPSRIEHPQGLAFDFLAPTPDRQVTTGHSEGIITLNILEADDLHREHERHALGEPYRTLVGHFRHELGHFYWDRFFLHRDENDPLLSEYRGLFGSEREDYAAALARHYSSGPGATWQDTHITGYATAHPWEDWAETWAQYLHIVDTMETARAFGWTGESVPIQFTPFTLVDSPNDAPEEDSSFLSTLNGWARLAPALNEIAASLGQATLYPFILSPVVVRKIMFVSKAVGACRDRVLSGGIPPAQGQADDAAHLGISAAAAPANVEVDPQFSKS